MTVVTALARWVHASECVLPDGTRLVPHETVVEIPAAELQSSHWEAVVEEPSELSKLKKDELVTLAGDAGVEVPDKATKADIVSLLEEHAAAQPSADDEPSEGGE